MKTEIKYILPDFTSYERNKILIELVNNSKYIKDNVSIYSFYGTFSNAIWNGGRVDLSLNKPTKSFMKKVRNFYNRNGIMVTFTFTNPFINEKDLYDEYCNDILEIFHNGMNQVLVVSPILEKYIRENYPKYKINKSITYASEKLENLEDEYNLIVINQKFNHNIDLLKAINSKEKIELLCDSICFDYCKKSRQHYDELAKIQLGEKKATNIYGKCKYNMDLHFRISQRNNCSKNYISPYEVETVYAPLGFKYFKLSERDKGGSHPFIAIDSIINYMIKEEYQEDVRTYIVEKILMERSQLAKRSLKKYGQLPNEYMS